MAVEGEPLYPADYYTDQEIPFRVSEIIREKAINRLREELPHSIYVEVADTELRDDPVSGKQRLWVRAFIITERESQKGMIVGKGGTVIKAIGQAARKELNSIFDWKVDLDLRVKTGRDWRHNDRILKKITGVKNGLSVFFKARDKIS
jgi:GTP-binding protein Era